MMTFVAIVHVIVAIVLIALVLLQDSKSDGALGIGGSGSNSLLGATGAQTLAAKMTMFAAIIFAVTCLALTYFTSSAHKSVIDSLPLPTALPQQAAPADATANPAAPAATPEAAQPAAPATENK